MASLENVAVKDSYTSLLKLSGNTDTLVAGTGSNAIQVVDGDGTASPLYLNTDRLGIGVQPTAPLHIKGANDSYVQLWNNHSDANIGGFYNNSGHGVLQVKNSSGATKVNLNANADTYFTGGNVLVGYTTATTNGGDTPQLQTHKTNNSNGLGVFQWGNNGAHSAMIKLAHSKSGTIGSHTILADNDAIGTIQFNGSDGTNFDTLGASIHVEVDGTPASNRIPSAMTFSTSAVSDDGNTERMRIDSSGNVGIGTASPNEGKLVVQDSTKAELVIKTSATATDTEAALMFKISTDTVDQRKKGGIIYKDVGDNGIGDMFFVLDSATDNGSANVTDNTILKLDHNSRISLSNNDGSGTSTVFGSLAGRDLAADGNYNTFVGDSAGLQNKLGINNVALGHNAMDDSYASDATDAGNDNNIFIGHNSGGGTWTGSAIGHACHSNVGIGTGVMSGSMEGANNNTAVGLASTSALTTGDFNTGIGAYSNYLVTAGGENTALGYSSGLYNETGSQNVYVGAFSGQGNSGDSHTANVGLGYKTLYSITTGGSNVAVGMQSADALTTGNQNVALGTLALSTSQDIDNAIAIGYASLNNLATSDADGTIAIGYASLNFLTSGQRNVAIGYESLRNNEIGDKNTAVGYQAMESFVADTDTHGNNTAVGHNVMQGNVTGTDNTAIGSNAGFAGTNNMTAGDGNTFVGEGIIPASSTPTNQTIVGQGTTGQADNSVTLGNASVDAVYMAQDKRATMLSGEIEVVQASDVNAPVAFIRTENSSNYSSSVVNIQGDRTTTNASYSLINAQNADVSGQFVVRDSGNAINTNNSYGATSDEKLKQDIADASSQWDDIKAVQFRKFKFKNNVEDGFKLGVVAQELEKISPKLISEDIDRDIDGKDLGTTTKSVKYSILQMKGLVALQEAMKRIEELETKVKELESK